MSNGRTNLTTPKVKALKVGEELRDTEVVGLFARGGHKGSSFHFTYSHLGKREKIVMGITSLEQARALGRKYRDMAAAGVSPKGVLEAAEEEERRKATEVQVVPATLKDLERRWELQAERSEKMLAERKERIANGYVERDIPGQQAKAFSFMKEKTIAKYRGHWRLLFSVLGEGKILASITQADIMRLHAELSIQKPGEKKGSRVGGPVTANRVVNFLSALLHAAILWELLAPEQAPHLKKMFDNIDFNQEFRKEVHLTEAQIPVFFDALERFRRSWGGLGKDGGPNLKSMMERNAFANLVDGLMATGCRISELTTAELTDIDWLSRTKVLHLKDSKTGAKTIALSDAAVDIFKARAEAWHAAGAHRDEAWLYPSPRNPKAHLTSPYKMWYTFLQFAGLPDDLTPHSIRHTIITMAINKAGMSLERAAAVAGHRNINTTASYTHRVQTSAADTMNRTMDAMLQMAEGKADLPDDPNIPAYMKLERENAKKLQSLVVSEHPH